MPDEQEADSDESSTEQERTRGTFTIQLAKVVDEHRSAGVDEAELMDAMWEEIEELDRLVHGDTRYKTVVEE